MIIVTLNCGKKIGTVFFFPRNSLEDFYVVKKMTDGNENKKGGERQ